MVYSMIKHTGIIKEIYIGVYFLKPYTINCVYISCIHYIPISSFANPMGQSVCLYKSPLNMMYYL